MRRLLAGLALAAAISTTALAWGGGGHGGGTGGMGAPGGMGAAAAPGAAAAAPGAAAAAPGAAAPGASGGVNSGWNTAMSASYQRQRVGYADSGALCPTYVGNHLATWHPCYSVQRVSWHEPHRHYPVHRESYCHRVSHHWGHHHWCYCPYGRRHHHHHQNQDENYSDD